jgi:hypothetical protein
VGLRGDSPLGCPAGRSPVGPSDTCRRASLDRTAGGGCPHIIFFYSFLLLEEDFRRNMETLAKSADVFRVNWRLPWRTSETMLGVPKTSNRSLLLEAFFAMPNHASSGHGRSACLPIASFLRLMTCMRHSRVRNMRISSFAYCENGQELEGIDPSDTLADNQRVHVVGALIGLH